MAKSVHTFGHFLAMPKICHCVSGVASFLWAIRIIHNGSLAKWNRAGITGRKGLQRNLPPSFTACNCSATIALKKGELQHGKIFC